MSKIRALWNKNNKKAHTSSSASECKKEGLLNIPPASSKP